MAHKRTLAKGAAMYIIGKISLDAAGRITITRLLKDKIPKTIGVAYDSKTKEIIVEPYDVKRNLMLRTLDDKNRISLPPWLRTIVKDNLYLVVDEEGNQKLKVIDFL